MRYENMSRSGRCETRVDFTRDSGRERFKRVEKTFEQFPLDVNTLMRMFRPSCGNFHLEMEHLASTKDHPECTCFNGSLPCWQSQIRATPLTWSSRHLWQVKQALETLRPCIIQWNSAKGNGALRERGGLGLSSL